MGLSGMSGTEPEFLAAVQKFTDVLHKHDKPRGGLAMGPPEVMKQLGKDNSLSFVAADVMALGGLAARLGPVKEMFPAERKMRREGSVNAEKVVVNVDKAGVAVANGHALTNGHGVAK